MNRTSQPRLTRQEAQARAARLVDALDAHSRGAGELLVDPRLGAFTIFSAARQLLIQRVADVLERDPGAGSLRRSTRMTEVARQVLYQARTQLRDRQRARRVPARWPESGASLRVLAVPREDHHLRDMLGVAEHLACEHGARVAWLVWRPDHLVTLRRAQQCAVLVAAAAVVDARRALRLVSENRRVVRTAGIDGLTPAVAEAITGAVDAAILPALTTASALQAAFQDFVPGVVLVGNPITSDGVITSCVAQARGVPAAAMQHGDLAEMDGAWARCGVDLFTVWGAHPAKVLADSGLPRSRIEATGAPWTDSIVTGPETPSSRPTVIVAMSGAGHSVGIDEHKVHVRRVFEAAAQRPDWRWLIRLHRKDSPELYRRMADDFTAAHPEIITASSGVPIHAQLPGVQALITVTSAAALDAMLHDVPVVTLPRPGGERMSAFAAADATTRVGPGDRLADVLTVLIEAGQAPTIRENAAHYTRGYFGVLDGHATARVAAAIVALAAAPSAGCPRKPTK